MDGEQPEIDLAHIHWSSPELIYSLPNKSLSTADEALDYFVYSPFFDVRSNNQVLRVQRRVTGVEYGHAQEKIDLLTFRSGFEFIISHSSPPSLFVVQKRNVEIQAGNPPGARSTNVLGQWFILDGKIYPCPTVYDVMATRLKNASFLVSSTFKTLESSRPASNPRTHSTWRSLPPSNEPENPSAEKEDSEGSEEKSKQPTTQAIPNYPLLNALKSSRDSIQYLENLAQGPRKKVEPLEELKSVEDEIMGSSLPNAVGKGVESERSVKSLSLLPGLGNRSDRGLGTPVSRLVSGKTPGLSVSSPLALQS